MNATRKSLLRWPQGQAGALVLLLALLTNPRLDAAESASSAGPRALPEGTFPDDERLKPLKDLDGYFPLKIYQQPAVWFQRATKVRRQIQVAQGLWPMPDKTPLNAVIYGKLDRGDYTVEKAYFESYPGFFVTGSLYRPKGKSGKVPAVLSPHGHWRHGRFYDQGSGGVRDQIEIGAERFEEGGRSMLQSRCVQLARMGCVVFLYDMLGYADSVQIPQSIAHGFKEQRSEMNTVENWGLFSPQAETHLQSVMGLQTWNSIRALDFLESLPDVDAARIGVTGASGGGTQTLMVCALDPRPAAAFPAVMVSTAMQGGCTCENASLLRIDAGNVEFAALFAPKPLGMTAADDWTKEMPTKGFPELKSLYAMLGSVDNVMLKPLLQFEHNYNYVSRAAMYRWFNRYLKLDLPAPILEQDYHRLTEDEASVWDDTHPKPPGGPEFERKLLRYIADANEQKLNASCKTLDQYRDLVGGALEVIFGRTLDDAGQVELRKSVAADRGSYVQTCGLLHNVTYNEELPVVLLQPKQPTGKAVIWVDAKGKSALFEGDQPLADVRKLLDGGVAVIGVDLLFQGEFLTNGVPVTKIRVVKNDRDFVGYTDGYNRPVFAQRVNDLLTLIKYAKENGIGQTRLALAGLDGGGPWVSAAVALSKGGVAAAFIDTGGFRFGKVLDVRSPDLLPGGAKYGDLPAILALCAPVKLAVSGEGESVSSVVRRRYEQANAGANVKSVAGAGREVHAAAIQFLLAATKE
jgi:dienelactone hydrolase